MSRTRCLALGSAFLGVLGLCGGGHAASITLSLVNPGSNLVVLPGTPVVLEVQATFDTRLSAVAFELGAVGAAGAELTARSLNPTGANGLTYVSRIMQDPFDSGLPHDLKASSITEVAYDADYGPAPGSAEDGLAPGSGVLMEQITVTPSGLGAVDITLANPSAAHTTASPAGRLFEIASVGVGSIRITVTQHGDVDGDGDIDLDDYLGFPACMTGPNAGPYGSGCAIYDFDTDNDVDLEDFSSFQDAFTG